LSQSAKLFANVNVCSFLHAAMVQSAGA